MLFSLGNNNIARMTEEVCSLKKLTWLNVSQNRLKTLPSQLTKLKSLSYLNVSSNDLAWQWNTHAAKTNLHRISEVYEPIDKARSTSLCLIWLRKKFRGKLGRFGLIPKEIVREIAIFIYSTKYEACWDPKMKPKPRSL